MVDLLGHVAMGLLWAVPVWLFWERRVCLAFLGCVLATVMVPDVDLYLSGVAHHGPTHTLLFVGAVSVAGGWVLVHEAVPLPERWWKQPRDRLLPDVSQYRFFVAALFVGGTSHLFIDLLSSGTNGNPPLNPFWPFFEKPFSVDFIYFTAPEWNEQLLAVALLAHLVLFLLEVVPTETTR